MKRLILVVASDSDPLRRTIDRLSERLAEWLKREDQGAILLWVPKDARVSGMVVDLEQGIVNSAPEVKVMYESEREPELSVCTRAHPNVDASGEHEEGDVHVDDHGVEYFHCPSCGLTKEV